MTIEQQPPFKLFALDTMTFVTALGENGANLRFEKFELLQSRFNRWRKGGSEEGKSNEDQPSGMPAT